MMHSRKDARPSHRYPAAAGSPSPPDRSSRSRRASLLAASVVLLLVAGWKWHDAAVAAPVRVGGIDSPTAVIVVQEGDCPDRRAALTTWVAERASEPGDRPQMRLAALGRRARVPEPDLGGIAALPAEHTRDAARALVRFGVEGTPALLLVDASGLPVLGASFATDGPGERLDFALRLLEPASGSVPPDLAPAGPRTRTFEPSEGDGNRWNP